MQAQFGFSLLTGLWRRRPFRSPRLFQLDAEVWGRKFQGLEFLNALNVDRQMAAVQLRCRCQWKVDPVNISNLAAYRKINADHGWHDGQLVIREAAA